jgi:MFS family permease
MAGALAFFALSPSFYLAMAAMAVVGFASMVVMTVNNTAIQLIIPDEMRGRVMSVMMMTFGLMPLGAVPAGIAAESLGAPVVVAVGAVLFAASVLLMFAVLPAFRRLDESLEEGRRLETDRREQAAASTGTVAAESA